MLFVVLTQRLGSAMEGIPFGTWVALTCVRYLGLGELIWRGFGTTKIFLGSDIRVVQDLGNYGVKLPLLQ